MITGINIIIVNNTLRAAPINLKVIATNKNAMIIANSQDKRCLNQVISVKLKCLYNSANL